MKIIRFIKGVSQFTYYLFTAWLNGLKNFWTDKDLYWFAHESYFNGEDAKIARDKCQKEVIELVDSYQINNLTTTE